MKFTVRYSLIALGCLIFSATLSSQTLKTGYVNIDSRRIYYEEKGRGRALLLIHGLSLDTRMWDDQFEAFSKKYRVIRYDMSGYGRSTVPDSAVSSSDEVAALLKSLSVKKATIIGMSLGGWVAIRFAVDYPQMVDALITLSSNLDGFQFTDQLRNRLASYPRIAMDSGLAKAKKAWLKDPFMTPVANIESVNARIRQIVAGWSGIQFSNPKIWSFTRTPPPAIRRLDEIHVPTLAIVGEKDDPNMHAIADTLAQDILGTKKIVIAGCGHLLNLERPDTLNKLIMDFLSANITTK